MQLEVRDVDVHYEVYGTGTPILMIHGWGPDHRLMRGCMEPVFRALPESYQRIYFDLPGMGKTPARPWINGSDAMLEVVSGVIDALIPQQHFLVAGESYGGYLARGLVARRSAMLDGVMLLCPVANPDTRQANCPARQVIEQDETLLERLSPIERQRFTTVSVRQTPRYWQRFSDHVLPGLMLADQAFLDQTLSQHVPFSFALDSPTQPFGKPSLILTGRQDDMVGYREQFDLLEAFPRASYAVLDRAGHGLESEQEALFAAFVCEWLDRVRTAEPCTQ